MSDKTAIEWCSSIDPETGAVTAGSTWNPIRGQNARHTCARISPGCDHCYAATMTRRGLMGTAPIDYGTGETPNDPARLDEQALLQPLKWKKPRKIFVCSMTDLFGTWVPVEWIYRIFAVMAECPQHTFIVLTKRPTRMRDVLDAGTYGMWAIDSIDAERYLPPINGPRQKWPGWPLPNVWVGTTIESDQFAWRADRLRQTPAAVRWVSAEPLLSGLPSLDLTGISWLVTGGESGPGARPIRADWVRDLRDRCAANGTAFFHKQWGEWLPGQNDPHPAQPNGGLAHWQDDTWRLIQPKQASSYVTWNAEGEPCHGFNPPRPVAAFAARIGRAKAGRLLDGVEWSQFPATATGAAS